MVVIRPVCLADLDQLLALAHLTGHGLTTLARDREFLRRRIVSSTRAFDAADDPAPSGQSYLFVLEDLKTGKVAGTSGIASKVGGFEPFYAYRIETAVLESEVLNIHKTMRTLHLMAEHNGPCEIGSLFLHPDFRRDGNGGLLSKARFLFMAQRPELFDPQVIAEMRGVIDSEGRSPFWDAVGKHFFEVDFVTADYLSVVNKRFIADLMPRHPLYIPLLPESAQRVIGQVHQQTAPALHILQKEGFEFEDLVDIFEAGPIVSCPRDQIATVRESSLATVQDITDAAHEGEPHLISNTSIKFRACLARVTLLPDQQVQLDTRSAMALGVRIGEQVRLAPAKRGKSKVVPASKEKSSVSEH